MISQVPVRSQYALSYRIPLLTEFAAQLKDATLKFEQVKKELAQLNERWEMLAEM
ncbi:hypothetical protein [Hymenobacter norwichensis]|uniref:hypothetical protein n=1 Tax=Hymenobacter norwichensis TaxID=223903 RepID=UPI0003B446B1|nr:hypothetical protein [Hymenobacter norwichensis]